MDRKLSVGIQGFEKLRQEQMQYVNKSVFVYQLVHQSVPIFLSRPRRFGKSLFLSTLKAYWEGKGDPLQGLKIEKWKREPQIPGRNPRIFVEIIQNRCSI